MFGRVAAGLVHDLSHPIQNIGNSTRLLMRDDLDPESREHVPPDDRARARRRSSASWTTCATSSSRSRSSASRWTSTARSPRSSSRCAPRASSTASRSRRTTRPEPLVIDGDRFALGRVYRNLITNAIQATAPGGRVTIATARVGDHVEISVTDTGSGIPADRICGDLRRLRHDQAPRPRPRPGDLQADCRAARRHDHGRKRGRARHLVHPAVPGARRSIGAGGSQLDRPELSGTPPDAGG